MGEVPERTAEALGGRGAEPSSGASPRRAVVIGGSMAGLLAARVLADHYARVTVVERDRLPESADPRPGVPQSRHTHVLVTGGQQALESLLPGLVGELREAGAPWVGVPRDLVQWQAGAWYRRTPATAHLLTGSRPLTEWLIRRRVLADPRVETAQGTEVVGLEGDAARVGGVVVRERGSGASQGLRSLIADLVVDASGRSSKAPGWLAAIGAEPPREETLDTGLAYASCVYRAEADDSTDSLGYYIVPNPGQVHGAVVLPVEDGRTLVTLSGLRGGEPPTDHDGFTDFARRLPDPLVHRWLVKAEPVSAVHGFRNTANIRRRYDRSGPEGFLATGDALCAFNPVYGQGMAVAALNAVALREALGSRRTPGTRHVQRAVFRSSQQAWGISAGSDKTMPGATGNAAASRAVDRPVNWYLARVQRRAAADPLVGAAFRSALSLASPLTSLFAPRIARAVLFGRPPGSPSDPPWWREAESGTAP